MRFTHIESARFTRGSSSSRFFSLRGFEFQVMFVVSDPGVFWSATPGSFETTLIALNGTWSTQSRLPCLRSAIIESAFV